MTLFYKAGIFIYSLLIRLFSMFNEKAKLFVKGRKNWKENLAQKSTVNRNTFGFTAHRWASLNKAGR